MDVREEHATPTTAASCRCSFRTLRVGVSDHSDGSPAPRVRDAAIVPSTSTRHARSGTSYDDDDNGLVRRSAQRVSAASRALSRMQQQQQENEKVEVRGRLFFQHHMDPSIYQNSLGLPGWSHSQRNHQYFTALTSPRPLRPAPPPRSLLLRPLPSPRPC